MNQNDINSTAEEMDNAFEEENTHLYSDVDSVTNSCPHDSNVAVLSSPLHSSSPFDDLLDWNTVQLSPGGVSLSADRSSQIRNEPDLVNAVHMHIQNNARIPNYNQPVDRSNSNSNSNRKRYQRNDYTPNSILPSHPEDNSMAELFLNSESSKRRTQDQTYEVLGSLCMDDTNIHMEIDPLETGTYVDPTPWSEIENKMNVENEIGSHVGVQQQQEQSCSKVSSEPKSSIVSQHPHHASYYPYGRHHQLPIPKNNHSPPQNPKPSDDKTFKMTEAIATAAAIACTVPSDNDSVLEVIDKSPGKYKSNIATNRIHINPFSRHLQRQRANDSVPPHAAAHDVSSASVLAAANRKSTYGFGGSHTVPSVPAPPSIRSITQQASRLKNVHPLDKFPQQQLSNKKTNKIKLPSTIPRKSSTSRANAKSSNTDADASYERKKQKAKDSRIKLNESIDRLAIAVSLAGSQSSHRINQLQHQIITTEFRQKSIQVNKEGVEFADKAKKWDRPSFVGTAASVIQSLNSQCEALMAELVAMQKLLDEEKMKNEICDTNTVDLIEIAQCSHKRNIAPSDISQKKLDANKRPRTNVTKDPTNDDDAVYDEIAKLLDPISLCRCSCVSKLWRHRRAFKNEDIWLNLAVKRFGYYNVRQWNENYREHNGKIISNKHLYKDMNSLNLMPHISREGLSLLGSGRIEGRICGWVFLVERSNGETLRSVKREPTVVASTTGLYQSRPVVELRIAVQNIGMGCQPIIVKSQDISVDISTRRRGGEFKEIDWDERFRKIVRNTDGTIRTKSFNKTNENREKDLCRLYLFETAVIEIYIDARGCSTTSKFRQQSNFSKLLVSLDGTTVPMVIPFLRDHNTD